MAISHYVRELRERVGTSLLLLPAVVGIVRDETERILVVKSTERGLWMPPSGAIDLGETPAQAIVREIREESGVDATVTSLLAVHGGPDCRVVYANGDEVEYIPIVFECLAVGGSPRADRDETSAARFVDESDWLELELAPIGRCVRTLAQSRRSFVP